MKEQMNEQQITNQESLDLIARMLRNTQERFERGAGTPFLIFGYLTLAVSIALWILLKNTGDDRWNFLWFAVPVIGGLCMLLFVARQPKRTVTTFIDRAISQVWYVIGGCCLLVSLYTFLFQHSFPTVLVVMLLMFAGEAITGAILKLRYVQIMGIIGILLSFCVPFLGGFNQLLGFAAMTLVVMVIPGHIMNAQARKTLRQTISDDISSDGHV